MNQTSLHWFRFFMVAFFLAATMANSYAQCLQSVSFTNWKSSGDSVQNQIQWVLGANDTSVQSQVNTNFPQFYLGPDTFMNVKITGKFEVETNFDDDYVGFVFGFKETWDYDWWINNDSMRHEYFLFDWKKNAQNYIGYVAQEGFSINEVDQTFARNIPNVFPSFWDHTNSATFQVLNTQFGVTQGWVSFQTYDFELYYTPTRAIVTIDADTIFDEGGCFEPGLFGFYSFSQQQTRYWDFNYELFIDFDMEAENVCLGDTAEFIYIDTGSCNGASVFSNIDTFYWDLGDGTITNDTNPLHIYDSAGYYDVYLIATDVNGCTDSAFRQVAIHEPPAAEFVFDDVCLGDSAHFYDSTSINVGSLVSWDWDFGDGNSDTSEFEASHMYTQSGQYTVELIIEDNAGCRDTVDSSFLVYDTPIVDFDIRDTCDGIEILMEDLSTSVNGNITARRWDIDHDGVVEYNDSISIEYLYNTYGTVNAELAVVDALGCRDSLVKSVTIHPNPIADFEAPNVCRDTFMVFADSSSIAIGQIAAWDWDFGDGNSSATAAPLHIYDTSGFSTVQLKVTSNEGCVDSTTKSVFVYHDPIPAFLSNDTCQYLELDIIQNSTSSSGQIVTYAWDFGNGTTSDNAVPIKAYQSPGLYNVQLGVKTEYGCKKSFEDSIRIYPAPVADFEWQNNVCEGNSLPFRDLSTLVQTTPGGDHITDWFWEFNEVTSTKQNPTYKTKISEVVSAKLTVTTNYGCMDNVRQYPEIFPLPTADFDVDIGCQMGETKFKDFSTVDDGIIESWVWDFGDGQTGTSENPRHVYSLEGTKKVKLTIASTYGCSNHAEQIIEIPPKPMAAFQIIDEVACTPLQTYAANQSEISSGTLSYEWYLDGQVVSQQKNPELRAYNDTLEPVTYAVRLVARSDFGCASEVIQNNALTVLPKPNAKFRILNLDIDMFNPAVAFENNTINGTRWQWTFGDGVSSTDFAPLYTYQNSGTYEVRLTAWNAYECDNSTKELVEVKPITTLYIPSAFTPNGDGDNDVFQFSGFNEGKKFGIKIWDRWGNLLIESDDFNMTWDGSMIDGRLAPAGVYVYHILWQRSSGEYQEIHGQLTLIR